MAIGGLPFVRASRSPTPPDIFDVIAQSLQITGPRASWTFCAGCGCLSTHPRVPTSGCRLPPLVQAVVLVVVAVLLGVVRVCCVMMLYLLFHLGPILELHMELKS